MYLVLKVDKEIIDFINKYDLVDMYRTLHNDTRKYSRSRFNSTKRDRLDYFISELLGLEVVIADIMPVYCSGHSLVCIGVLILVLLQDTAPCRNSITHSFEIRCL